MNRRALSLIAIVLAAGSGGDLSAQTSAPARAAVPAKLDANMLQLMRGVLYPASNVLFAAQDDLSKQP